MDLLGVNDAGENRLKEGNPMVVGVELNYGPWTMGCSTMGFLMVVVEDGREPWAMRSVVLEEMWATTEG